MLSKELSPEVDRIGRHAGRQVPLGFSDEVTEETIRQAVAEPLKALTGDRKLARRLISATLAFSLTFVAMAVSVSAALPGNGLVQALVAVTVVLLLAYVAWFVLRAVVTARAHQRRTLSLELQAITAAWHEIFRRHDRGEFVTEEETMRPRYPAPAPIRFPADIAELRQYTAKWLRYLGAIDAVPAGPRSAFHAESGALAGIARIGLRRAEVHSADVHLLAEEARKLEQIAVIFTDGRVVPPSAQVADLAGVALFQIDVERSTIAPSNTRANALLRAVEENRSPATIAA
ncbi:hypothetical protein ACFVAJ_17865 [Agromyces sp. NPDC057679]|uniref:hypothetical protein n=1 Tax=Agromyces sp. NPDC057679 TaxID=3346207 RepID=UPI003672131E